MLGFYWVVVRRAAQATFEYSREHLIRLFVGLLLFAIVARVLSRLLPFVDRTNQVTASKVLDDLSANYAADLTVTAGFLILGGLLLFGWNVLKIPVFMFEELQQRVRQADGATNAVRQQLDDVLKSPEHIAHLRHALRLVPNGRPQQSLLYDALREHLPDNPIWMEQERLRTLVHYAVDGKRAVEDRLTAELISHNLAWMTGGRAVLSRRVAAACASELVSFPDEPWYVEEHRLLKLGRDFGIAEVHTIEDVARTVTDIINLWEAIPTWPEVVTVAGAELALPEARDTLDRHIAELELHPQFPGRCHLCAPRDAGPT